MTITVTALRWLSREILPRVLDVLWLYALLGLIDLWWLYGWHVGVTALVAFCGIAWFALYKKRSQPRQSEARHEFTSDNRFSSPFRDSGLRGSFGGSRIDAPRL